MTLDKPSGGLKFVVLGGRAQGEMAAFQVGVGQLPAVLIFLWVTAAHQEIQLADDHGSQC